MPRAFPIESSVRCGRLVMPKHRALGVHQRAMEVLSYTASQICESRMNMASSSEVERLRIAPVTGTGRLHFHVYYEEFFDGTIHENSAGWHWSSHHRVLGPYATAGEARQAVAVYYAKLSAAIANSTAIESSADIE
jgi:hypothetical protein